MSAAARADAARRYADDVECWGEPADKSAPADQPSQFAEVGGDDLPSPFGDDAIIDSLTDLALEALTLITGGIHSLCSDRGGHFGSVGFYDDAAALLAAARSENRPDVNVWRGVHHLGERPTEGRGGDDDIVSMSVLAADLDWYDPGEPHAHPGSTPDSLPSETEVRAALARLEWKPTLIVNSGHGVQPYWVLWSPVDADVGHDLTLRLHSAIETLGIPADRSDRASVLRIPGTTSYKPNCTPVAVTVEDYQPERLYMSQNLGKYLPKAVGRRASGGGGGGVASRGHEAVVAQLLADDRRQDAEALRVACEIHGGHDPWITRKGHVEVTRPDKQAGTSATVGFVGPGIVKMFTPSWEHDGVTFEKDGRYTVNAEGTALEPADDLGLASFIADEHEQHDGEQHEQHDGDRLRLPPFFSDAEVGATFGRTIAGRYLHCRALGGWHVWDGRRWHRDESESVFEEARRYILNVGKALFDAGADSEKIKAAARYRDRGKIDAVVTIARRLDGIAATSDEFDRHPHLLNCHNGVVDLRDGTISGHDPKLRLRQLAGADYIPDATHPDIDVVIAVMSPRVRVWVQRLLGSATVGSVVDDIVTVFDGKGSNGKTTLLKAAYESLGDYATPASTRLLIAKATHDEHPTLIADLLGRRLVYIEETPEGGSLKMEQLKALSGGTPLKARFIAKDQFEFQPTHQFVIATNHRPAVNASDYAAWRRLRLVPFANTYVKPHEARHGDLVADLGLRSRLGGRLQREAALAWLVEGAITWHRDGLGGCIEVDEATAAWRRAEDVIEAWWADCILPDPNGITRAADLYNSMSYWCERNGRPTASNKEFVKKLTDHRLYESHRVERRTGGRHGNSYAGLTTRSDPLG